MDLKRRIAILSTVAVVLFFLIIWMMTGGRGNTSSCERYIGASKLYSEHEIGQAMDLVESVFESEFKGCYLISLTYEEELSMLYCDDWASQYDADEALILASVFDVGPSGGDGSLKQNSTYSNWQWVLTRNKGESWTLQTWGY